MTYLARCINKPFGQEYFLNLTHCPNCLKSIHDKCGKKIHFRSLHNDGKRFTRQFGYLNANYVDRSKIVKNVWSYNNARCVQTSSLHSLLQSYASIFQSISESNAVTSTQNFLINIHDSTGLPWWATVAVTTFLFRSAITLPLALYQQYILAKVENLTIEYKEIVKKLQEDVQIGTQTYKWSPELANAMYRIAVKSHWTLLLERDNCHPAKSFIVVLFQVPMWILFSMSLRNLVSMRPFYDEAAEEVYDQMKHEGFLWISDLTIPDSTMIIPCTLCLVSLSIVEINRMMHIQHPSTYKKMFTNILRCSALITLPFGYIVPSCLSLYWLTSATVGLCQNLIVMSPRIRLLVGIPRTPTTLMNPYSHLRNQIQNIFKPSKASSV